MTGRPMPEVSGVEHRFVDARGLRFHVAEAGSGEPVVMLHGWPQHWWEWRRQIPVLAQRYRVVCLDLRGFGWSDAPADGYEKENMADDVLAIMDALELRRVRLVGHDWGGWIGFLLGIRAPERIERFLALNVTHPFLRASPRIALSYWRFFYQWMIASPFAGRRAVAGLARRANVVGRWVGAGAWTLEEARIFLGQFAEPERAHASVQLYRTFVLREGREVALGRYRRSRLTVPTLLLFGTGDQVLRPAMLRGYGPHADDMTVEFVEGVSHFIADQAPDLVNRRALDFFA
jgi:pimeloyl-ACP methyl ester carboxylesterase